MWASSALRASCSRSKMSRWMSSDEYWCFSRRYSPFAEQRRWSRFWPSVLFRDAQVPGEMDGISICALGGKHASYRALETRSTNGPRKSGTQRTFLSAGDRGGRSGRAPRHDRRRYLRHHRPAACDRGSRSRFRLVAGGDRHRGRTGRGLDPRLDLARLLAHVHRRHRGGAFAYRAAPITSVLYALGEGLLPGIASRPTETRGKMQSAEDKN